VNIFIVLVHLIIFQKLLHEPVFSHPLAVARQMHKSRV